MKKLILFIGLIAHYSFSQCADPLITDFECDPPSQTLPPTVVAIANSFNGGINTSPRIGQYTDDGTQGFDALVIDYGATIDLSTNNILKFKIYTPTSIQVLAKIEGGMNPVEIFSDFSQINTWEEFTFNFSASAGDGHTRLILFFNPTVTTGTLMDLYYFDDLGWTNMNILNSPNFDKGNGLTVYTPSADELVIESDFSFNALSLFDISGKMVKSKKNLNEKKAVIDIRNLVSGIYFVNVISEGAIQHFKMFIQ